MLHDKATASRGTFAAIASGAPNATFPRTTARDAIALVFDTAVNDHTSGHVVARWIWESDLLAGEPEDSIATYIGNRSFWQTLANSAVELDRVHATLPSQALAERQLDLPSDGNYIAPSSIT
jgi:hypothetical protein